MGLRIESLWYRDLEIMFWVLFIKVNLVLILSLWFFFNKEWWRYAILPILCHTIFQFFSALNDNLEIYPIFQLYHSIYFYIVLIPTFLVVDKIINYQPISLSDKIEELTEDTLTKLIKFDRKNFIDLKRELEILRSNKEQISRKEYLLKLLIIQKRIEKK